MLFNINQIKGKNDKSPGEEALLTEANVLTALKQLWGKEDFIVNKVTEKEFNYFLISNLRDLGYGVLSRQKLTKIREVGEAIIKWDNTRGRIPEQWIEEFIETLNWLENYFDKEKGKENK